MAILSGEIPGIAEAASGPIEYPDDPFWLLCLVLVWVVVGTASGLALGLSLVGRLGAGMALAQYALLLGLVAGGLLDAFVSQLGALSGVIIQLGLLLLIMDQRSRLEARSTTS